MGAVCDNPGVAGDREDWRMTEPIEPQGTKEDGAGEQAKATKDSRGITLLLENARAGEPGAKDRLLDCVYHELRSIAERQMANERGAHTLQATALVNEAYMKVLGGQEPSYENHRHLFGAFAQAMREVLIDSARRRNALKRGGDRRRVGLDGVEVACEVARQVGSADVLALDAALPKLERVDQRAAEVVRYRYFLGMTESQIAEILGVSEKTVQRDWKFARAYLRKAILGEEAMAEPDQRDGRGEER